MRLAHTIAQCSHLRNLTFLAGVWCDGLVDALLPSSRSKGDGAMCPLTCLELRTPEYGDARTVYEGDVPTGQAFAAALCVAPQLARLYIDSGGIKSEDMNAVLALSCLPHLTSLHLRYLWRQPDIGPSHLNATREVEVQGHELQCSLKSSRSCRSFPACARCRCRHLK